MRNKFPAKAYQAIKNDLFTLVSFKDGVRVLTYSGLPAHSLIEEMTRGRARSHMVFKDHELKGNEDCQLNIAFFENKKIELAVAQDVARLKNTC